MANKKLQGITIEIDGNTTKLSKSLEQVNKAVKSTSSELKEIQKDLKLDPSSTVLLAQKQQVLQDSIEATKIKLKQLKEAKEQADKQMASGDTSITAKDYRELEREIASTEKSLSKMEDELKDSDAAIQDNSNSVKELAQSENVAGQGAVKLGTLINANLISEAIKTGLREVINLVKQLGEAFVELTKQSIKNFAEYEQLVGGIESMFGGVEKGNEQINQVIKKGSNAWKELTMSESEYYKAFTSTYPLIKADVEDSNKAIEQTNRLLQIESDLANTFGYDMETAGNAINWALKGSFNYIDNLNLGIKGTQEGFLEAAKNVGILVDDVKDLSSEQILYVIEEYSKKVGALGKTAEEANTTIQGSFKSLQASWENLLTGLSNKNADIGDLLGNLSESIMSFLDNLVPIIGTALSNIFKSVSTIADKYLPTFLQMGFDMIQNLLNGMEENASNIVDVAKQIISIFLNSINKNIKPVMDSAVKIVDALADGIIEYMPEITEVTIEILMQIIETIIANLDIIMENSMKINTAIVEGILKALPKIIEKIPLIIYTIANTLTDPKYLLQIAKCGVDLITALIKGLYESRKAIANGIVKVIGYVFSDLTQEIKKKDWGKIGYNIIMGMLNGMTSSSIYSSIKKTVSNIGNSIKNSITSFFQIKSPSRLMANEVGKYIPLGIAKGIEDEIPRTLREVDSAMAELNKEIEASVNPTINTSANANPLVIQIENFNNTRQTDVETLAQELEFYRKNSALATGGK